MPGRAQHQRAKIASASFAAILEEAANALDSRGTRLATTAQVVDEARIANRIASKPGRLRITLVKMAFNVS
jgi:hypothetical protein